MDKWNDFLRQYFGKNTKGKIAQYLYNINQEIFETNLSNLALKINVAPSTITKFLKSIGFDGWKEYIKYAQSSLKNKNQNQTKLSSLIRQKILIMDWIESHYQQSINKLVSKILEAKRIILIAHGATMGYLKLFERALTIIGKNCSLYDMSDKFLDLPNHTNIVYFVVSISGENDHLNWIIKNFKHLNLANKYFVTASPVTSAVFNQNFNFKKSNIKIQKLENAIPVAQISFVQHLIDLIISNLLEKREINLNQRLAETGIIEKIAK